MEDVEKNGWDVEGSRRGATAAGTAGVAGDLPPIWGAGGGEKGFWSPPSLGPDGPATGGESLGLSQHQFHSLANLGSFDWWWMRATNSPLPRR